MSRLRVTSRAGTVYIAAEDVSAWLRQRADECDEVAQVAALQAAAILLDETMRQRRSRKEQAVGDARRRTAPRCEATHVAGNGSVLRCKWASGHDTRPNVPDYQRPHVFELNAYERDAVEAVREMRHTMRAATAATFGGGR